MKNTHGGANRNQGAKPKYNEPTTTIAFRVPVSKVTELKGIIKEYLQQFKKPL
jgi:hypothetical protein